VSVDVVVSLEEVYIQHYQGEHAAEAGTAGDFLLQAFVEVAVIIEAGQPVGVGPYRCLGIEAGVFNEDAGLSGHAHYQLYILVGVEFSLLFFAQCQDADKPALGQNRAQDFQV